VIDCIINSHRRCTSAGFLTENIYSTRILTETEIKDKLQKNKELILTAIPFMNRLYNFVKGSGFFAILCASDGCILNAIGDKNILSEAMQFKMIPGAYMDEAHIGTNAMSIAISEKMPVQISGNEHFIRAYRKWTCSAAPITDSNGSLIGVIDLTGYIENVHPHTLGMVVAAADAISRMLEINKYNSMLEISKKRLETTFNSISSGILTCDLKGTITTMNKQIVKIFSCSENEIGNQKITDMIQNWNEILNRLRTKRILIDENAYINSKESNKQYALSLYPIYDSNMNIEEITIVFNETKIGRKLAGKILSGQAVYTFDKVIAKNETFKKTINYAKKIAVSDSTILITGESGTGKEVFAQAIHNYSLRRDEPFIAMNCGAIPRTLIESELFGYEDGAFTGAKKGGNAGKFELADGGTIFLDEIGEMPIDMQIKLLRVIEQREVTRIGSSRPIPVNVRIMAATNKDLKYEIERGNFRKDLYYRLNVLPLYLPPLRERKEDIPELVNYYMRKTANKLGKQCIPISDEYMNYLINYDWPGNIRELENIIELFINTEELHINFSSAVDEIHKNTAAINNNASLEEVEKDHIIKVLESTSGNVSLAANILEIGRNTLYRKIDKFKINCSSMEQSFEMEQD
jgi:transcriptional regulator of acetoin/glycerol metabolism